jgi:hypothetical protein
LSPQEPVKEQIMKAVLILGRDSVTYWLDQTLPELGAWLKVAASLKE